MQPQPLHPFAGLSHPSEIRRAHLAGSRIQRHLPAQASTAPLRFATRTINRERLSRIIQSLSLASLASLAGTSASPGQQPTEPRNPGPLLASISCHWAKRGFARPATHPCRPCVQPFCTLCWQPLVPTSTSRTISGLLSSVRTRLRCSSFLALNPPTSTPHTQQNTSSHLRPTDPSTPASRVP